MGLVHSSWIFHKFLSEKEHTRWWVTMLDKPN